jgi:tetratricopeptide (TPR) repeat protein
MESNNTNTTNTTARSVYERTGDATAALELLKLNEGNSSSTPYNEFLCKSMVSQCQLSSKWLRELEAKQDETEALAIEINVSQSPSLLAISKWIMTYNRGLCLIMLQRPNETWDLVWPMFESDVIINKNSLIDVSSNTTGKNKKTTKEMEEFLNVSCHMALLLLQALLEPNFNESLKSNFQRDVKLTLDWLQAAVTDQVPLLKFLCALVNSRMELSPNHKNSMSNAITDNKIRTARKELKQAMEIFQHKLKTASTMQSNNQESSALNLKANTERLKGNVKKSLVLLGEAKTDQTDNTTNLEQMDHYNNLALVYHSDGKPNLALHSWSKALSFATTDKQSSAILQSNGTPQTNHQISVLYNASLTCLQHQKFQAAYECMAVVVKHWNHRADCWSRLAEACIGWNARLKETQLAKFQTASNSQG